MELDNIVVPRKHWLIMQMQINKISETSKGQCKTTTEELMEQCRDIENLNVCGKTNGKEERKGMTPHNWSASSARWSEFGKRKLHMKMPKEQYEELFGWNTSNNKRAPESIIRKRKPKTQANSD